MDLFCVLVHLLAIGTRKQIVRDINLKTNKVLAPDGEMKHQMI